jgi:hypothetical protein
MDDDGPSDMADMGLQILRKLHKISEQYWPESRGSKLSSFKFHYESVLQVEKAEGFHLQWVELTVCTVN